MSSFANRASKMANTLLQETLYYLRVGQHIALRVYEKEKMSPPNAKELEASSKGLLTVARQAIQMVRNKQMPNVEQLKSTGKVGLELVGFFTIGEMIGRGSILPRKPHVHH
eukprot:NODE_183_length_13752_cov_1.079103.p12 type:complete len:111 gc:universal NODE_183_length_13752_cov_1.079103:4999-4667(-)